MSLTLNQIVKQITTLGNDHEQINFVYFGDVWERLSNGEVTYPAMFYTLTGATINAKGRAYFKAKEGANLKPPVSSKEAKKSHKAAARRLPSRGHHTKP